MSNALVFDTGPIISLTLNNLLWLLEPLKQRFGGEFYMPKSVKRELIDRPLETRKYKFEALQIMPYLHSGILRQIVHQSVENKARELLDIANRCFKAKGSWIQIVHFAEMECVAAALHLGTNIIVIDERNTRHLIEDPMRLMKRMESKLHTKISLDKNSLEKLREELRNLRVLRSAELVTIAYELGMLDTYIYKHEEQQIKEPKRALLEGVLWAIKLNGCSISQDEIDDIIDIERRTFK